MTAAALLALDPAGLGGVVLRGPPGPARDRWLAALRAMLPDQTPWRRLPLAIGEDRLLGGLDLGATLAAGRPLAQRGILAEADGGIILLPCAERLDPGTAATRGPAQAPRPASSAPATGPRPARQSARSYPYGPEPLRTTTATVQQPPVTTGWAGGVPPAGTLANVAGTSNVRSRSNG